jgi:peptidoglycan-N-acetylglucosamine deacetylase
VSETGKSSLRRLIPQPVRLALYEVSRGRRRLWNSFPGLECLPEDPPSVAITFDDGPGEVTADLLDALERESLPATFFLLGEQVAERPELAREVVARGHEVAVHGSQHLRHDQVEPDRAAEDVRRGLGEIEEACSVRPRWYRPPFGRFAAASYAACQDLELRPAYWSTWGYDWEPLSAARIIRRVDRGLGAGAIVLLHDSARYAERASAVPTVEAVPLLAQVLRERGLAAVTLSDAT